MFSIMLPIESSFLCMFMDPMFIDCSADAAGLGHICIPGIDSTQGGGPDCVLCARRRGAINTVAISAREREFTEIVLVCRRSAGQTDSLQTAASDVLPVAEHGSSPKTGERQDYTRRLKRTGSNAAGRSRRQALPGIAAVRARSFKAAISTAYRLTRFWSALDEPCSPTEATSESKWQSLWHMQLNCVAGSWCARSASVWFMTDMSIASEFPGTLESALERVWHR
jgi:hypothetical protein